MPSSTIFNEIFQSAQGKEVVLSQAENLRLYNESRDAINAHTNELSNLSINEAIALICVSTTKPKANAEYIGALTTNLVDDHIQFLKRAKLTPIVDNITIFRAINAYTGPDVYVTETAFRLAEDEASPLGYSLTKLLMVTDPSRLTEEMRKLIKLPMDSGIQYRVLFSDKLTYAEDECLSNIDVISNLLNLYFVLNLAGTEKLILENDDAGSYTYCVPTGQVPASWFEIFADIDEEDFDLQSKLVDAINNILVEKDIKLSDFT